jgi:transposase
MPYKTDLTDAEFALIQPLLQISAPAKTGRPRSDDRALLNGILWRLDNGAKWRAVPPEYGAWPTVYLRFRQWTEAGVWQRIIEILQSELRAKDRISFDFAAIDGTIVRAHKCAAGAKKNRPK